MAKHPSRKAQRLAAPDWVFNWRPRRESAWHKFFAILAVGGFFAFALTSLRIRVVPPAPWTTHKASVIHIIDDTEGRALTLRAREGGPFPSRFDPTTWQDVTTIEQTAFEDARWRPLPYVLTLRPMADEVTIPVTLAAPGEVTLPKLKPEAQAAPVATNLQLAPVLYPLSGIQAAMLPRDLPAFDGMVNASTSAEPLPFLVRLDAAGHVLDCVSLTDGEEEGIRILESWLRRVSFNPEPTKPSRWIAIGVGFINQPSHGPDPH